MNLKIIHSEKKILKITYIKKFKKKMYVKINNKFV